MRVVLVAACAALTACALAVVSANAILAPDKPQAKCSRPQGVSPDAGLDVAIQFIRQAALRLDPWCAFPLAAREVRQGQTRESWKGGNIPVPAFPGARTVSLEPRLVTQNEAGEPQVGFWVSVDGTVCELSIVRRHGLWFVDYFGTAGFYSPPAEAP